MMMPQVERSYDAKKQARHRVGIKTLLVQIDERLKGLELTTSAIADRLDEVEREHDHQPRKSRGSKRR
jgi:hypothetical protein